MLINVQNGARCLPTSFNPFPLVVLVNTGTSGVLKHPPNFFYAHFKEIGNPFIGEKQW